MHCDIRLRVSVTCTFTIKHGTHVPVVPCSHGGVTCHNFGYGCAAGVPEPHPIHIPGQVKNMTHSYTSHIEN